MTDSAMEAYKNSVTGCRPPWLDKNGEYIHFTTGKTFHWDLPKETVWQLFKLLEKALEERGFEETRTIS